MNAIEQFIDALAGVPQNAGRKSQPKPADAPAADAGPPAESTVRCIADTTLRALPGLVGYTPSAGFIASIAEHQRKYDAALERINTLGLESVRRLHDEQTQHGIDAVLSGDPAAAGRGGAYHSKLQLREALLAERAALKSGVRALIAQAAEEIRAEASKFTVAATRYADDMESREKDLCEALSIKYEPSSTLRTIRAALATVEGRIPGPDRILLQSPRSMTCWTTV